jgi:hypothetical protein
MSMREERVCSQHGMQMMRTRSRGRVYDVIVCTAGGVTMKGVDGATSEIWVAKLGAC